VACDTGPFQFCHRFSESGRKQQKLQEKDVPYHCVFVVIVRSRRLLML